MKKEKHVHYNKEENSLRSGGQNRDVTMKIEVWSDFVCPFCYIGKRRLEEALESFPHRENVEVVFRRFELDPNAKKETPLSIVGIDGKEAEAVLDDRRYARTSAT